jgi:hypothetical protein
MLTLMNKPNLPNKIESAQIVYEIESKISIEVRERRDRCAVIARSKATKQSIAVIPGW